jgi:hypothetical protein
MFEVSPEKVEKRPRYIGLQASTACSTLFGGKSLRTSVNSSVARGDLFTHVRVKNSAHNRSTICENEANLSIITSHHPFDSINHNKQPAATT